ncbi:U32 family peptidase [cf. Phormidesmis sp. LEGE 11477]|uniref:U32 family peptidase n=1 Tax=cf. Phormidesmis sp. LEGE 11477 TaxID=1828680 RepID=UPI00187E2C68|nr:U32 family peptidase [cf. Phormidesmis sp. LEGE 11477]MBE9062143.1 U32 family peptidase [cf. Phormidesmis sp. LEGE 11477]
MVVSSHLPHKRSESVFGLHRPEHKPELLAPAGDWDCVKAAVENGADAIYFGLDRFNARMRAHNFTAADLPELMAFLRARGVRGYVTLNTLIFPKELKAAAHYLRTIITAGVDAAIVQDVGICRLIRHLSPDFPIHASTQMTVTSAAGVKFAQRVGTQLVVLARECSIKEINRIQRQLKKENMAMPLETFVHGALCVAYSGQCLTSESLGGRSANRGECAQACRMTYELIADGEDVDLSAGGAFPGENRAYLLSPQDLSGLSVVPDLIKSGVASLKIEGRLKTPEYVANVTRVYRRVLDQVIEQIGDRVDEQISEQPAHQSEHQIDLKFGRLKTSYHPSADERYSLEMAFSRGLSTGWFQGIDNQKLVHGRFGKKRGALIGRVERIIKGKRENRIVVESLIAAKPGDGVVVDSGQPDNEQGGRLYGVETRGKETFLSFGRNSLDFERVRIGDRIWKTSDPELDKAIRKTYSGDRPQFKRPVSIEVVGKAGEMLKAIAHDDSGHIATVTTDITLVTAHSKPLTTERLIQQFSRLGNTPFELAGLQNNLAGNVMMPVSMLNQLRRDLVAQLIEQRQQPKLWTLNPHASYRDLLPDNPTSQLEQTSAVQLIPLVRTLPQLEAAIATHAPTIYCEFENPVRYREAVALTRTGTAELFIAPPRISKPSERYILDQVRQAKADGYLVRNYDQLDYFSGDRIIADFSLNIANPVTADYFKREFNLERLCASYDLNVQQLEDLLETAPAQWFDITLHQHMPMFHMAHCVYCAFLSEGTDFTNCGRPCEKHDVKLRDRTGAEHILSADAGCRNTLFNGKAQTGAEFASRLIEKGARYFRIEFLNETPEQVTQTLSAYQKLVDGDMDGGDLWRSLNLSSQLGVTRGTLEKSHR